MITIREVLGPNWREYKLYDNNSLEGGLTREEETLIDFLYDTDIDQYCSVSLLQLELKECGLKEIEEIDRYVEKVIEEKLAEIEEELDIQFCDYRWDYELNKFKRLDERR